MTHTLFEELRVNSLSGCLTTRFLGARLRRADRRRICSSFFLKYLEAGAQPTSRRPRPTVLARVRESPRLCERLAGRAGRSNFRRGSRKTS